MASPSSRVQVHQSGKAGVVQLARQTPRMDVDVLGLLRAAQAGDAAACERLFVSIRPYALHVAYAFLRNVPTAVTVGEDVAQEALLRAWIGLEACRAGTTGEVLAWVRTITQRLAIDVLRGHAQRVSFGGVELVDDSGSSANWTPSGEGGASDADQKFLERLTFEAYSALGDNSAEALWMHLVCSAGWEEVGKALDISPTAAKRRFQRAQLAIRRSVLRRVGELSVSDRAFVLAPSAKLPLAV